MSRVEGDVFLSYKPPEAPDWRKCKKRRRSGDDHEHEPAEVPLARGTIQSLEDAKSLCWRQAQAVYREVAEEVYGETFAAISTFLEQSRSESSQWGQVLQLLQASAASSSGAASAVPPPAAAPSLLSHGGFNCLIPCAIVHPNMSVADRPRLVQLLLDALVRNRRPLPQGASPPPLTVTLTPHRHNSLVKIFSAMHEAIHRELQCNGPRRASHPAARRGPSASSAGCTSLQDVLSLYSLLPSSAPSAGPLSGLGSGGAVRRRLLLVFTDVEAVDRRLLENLLCLLGERQLRLPVQLLFLVSATCPFSANLGSAATSTLQAATFVLPPCSLCFDKLLTRLFLDRELPVMLSARVLRFLRATFLESHLSIEVFFQHLDLILYLHFQHVSSLLCMLPYNQLLEPTAAAAGRQGETSGAGGRGMGGRCLALNPKSDDEWLNPHTEKAFMEIDRLLQVPSLQSTPIGATPMATYRHIQKTVRGQVNNRCQAWAAANILAESFRILQPGGSLDSSPLCMYELLLDVQRPARWAAIEEKLKDLIANVSLRELDLLLQAWAGVILTLLPFEGFHAQGAMPRPAGATQPQPQQPPLKGANPHAATSKPVPASGTSAGPAILPSSSHDPSTAPPPAPVLAACDSSATAPSKPPASPPPVVPVYVRASTTLRLWRANIDMLTILLQSLAKDTRQFQTLLNKKGASESKAVGVMMGSGFQSKRMALAAKAQQKEGKGEEEEDKDDIPPELHKKYQEFCVKERGVRNAAIEMLCGVTEDCGNMVRSLGPGHEAVWFDYTQELEDHFLTQVRAVTAHSLGDPQHYLQCRCCKSGEVSHTCPDLCIAYTLYEEDPRRNVAVGKMLESFTDITMAGGKRRPDEGGSEQMKLRLQHALLGLETMGFVRPYGTRGEWSKIVYSYTVMQPGTEEGQDP